MSERSDVHPHRVRGRAGAERARGYAKRHAPLLAALAATLVCAAGFGAHASGVIRVPGLEALELLTLDTRFRVGADREPEGDRIVIVGLDDDTRRRVPEIFREREQWAELLRRLSEHEPKAIAIDALFSSPERPLPEDVTERAREALEALAAQDELSPAGRAARGALEAVLEAARGDEHLAEAIDRAQAAQLAFHLFLADGAGEHEPVPPDAAEPEVLAPARYAEAVVLGRPADERPRDAYGYQGPLPEIAVGGDAAGHLNVMLDEDGTIRRVPAVLAYGERYYMPLGLSMALAELGEGASYVTGDDHVTVGDRRLPVTERADFKLSFLGPARSFPHVSAADVLEGELAAGALEDKLVFIGYTDAARDQYQAPLDASFPGVEVHATLAHNVLYGDLLRAANARAGVGAILVLGGLLALVQIRRLRRRRAWLTAAVGLGGLAAYAAVAQGLFSAAGVVAPVAAPALSCVIVALSSLSAALATEGREKAKLKAAFSQYVSDALVERIAANPSRARLGGERRELTVLFSDVRGFTEFAEDLEPEALSAYMNEYLTPMTRLVMNERGMLDKYIGDSLMAVYGAPLSQADHAARACRSALAMLGALEALNATWRARGLPEMAIGIGINSGMMSVGNMGSEARFDYTVLGDAVNLGARLEGLTKEYGVSVLCGERTAELARGDFVFRELDTVRVKGRAGRARIFELAGAAGEAPLSAGDLELFAEGLAAYRARDWERAEESLSAFLDRHPGDGPADVLRQRCHEFRASPPPADWDGVYTQRSK